MTAAAAQWDARLRVIKRIAEAEHRGRTAQRFGAGELRAANGRTGTTGVAATAVGRSRRAAGSEEARWSDAALQDRALRGRAVRCDGSDRSVVQVYPSPTVHIGGDGGDRPGGDLEGG